MQFDTFDVYVDDLSPIYIAAFDHCGIMRLGDNKDYGPLCDYMYSVPRKWTDIVFSAVNSWSVCRSDEDKIPCHHANLTVPKTAEGHNLGSASQCLLTGWLMDHGIKPELHYVQVII